MARRISSLGLGLAVVALFLALPGCEQGGPGGGFGDLAEGAYSVEHLSLTIGAAPEVDVLFVIDDSSAMAARQQALGRSFGALAAGLAGSNYHLAVITTGIESPDCPPCPADDPGATGCLNETGESGRFQDLLGHDNGASGFDFVSDPDCRVMDRTNAGRCFFDAADERGVVLAGSRGCGYERGLEAIRLALSEPLLSTWNEGFLRSEAELWVVVLSDEEDCGQVGDVTEGIPGVSGDICYWAAKGVAPDGADKGPEGKSLALTPVSEYYDFLMGLKGNQEGMVRFAAIVGVGDPEDPGATQIEYDGDTPLAGVLPACSGGCEDPQAPCQALPGTRYAKLASLFGLGQNGFVGTVCQDSYLGSPFSPPDSLASCPRAFHLQKRILSRALVSLKVDDRELPAYSCSGSSPGQLLACDGPDDAGCPAGACVETWRYLPPEELGAPDPAAPGGEIVLADHYDLCELAYEDPVRLELTYVTE